MNVPTFLESEGGKMAVIIGMLLWLSGIAVYLLASGHTPQETGRTLLSNSFTALFTLLVAKLGDKKTPPSGGPSA